MKKYLFIFAFVLGLATSCGTASLSSITPNVSFDGYRYFYVINTEQLTSGSGGVYGGNGTGVWGSSSTKSVNPSDVINGYMMKKGFIRLSEIKPEIGDQTLLIAYGESGRHPNLLGYSTEVTIQFLNAKTNEVVAIVTGDGMGDTEADDIRKAILNCMKKVFNE